MSPGGGIVEQVENLLFCGARAHQIENVVVGEFNDLRYALSHLSRRFRLPLSQPCVQPLNQYVHGDILPRVQFSSAGSERGNPAAARNAVKFARPDLKRKTVKVDAAYVRKQLAGIVKDQDLSRYIL